MASTAKQSSGNEYSLVSSYKLGYRNREDITNLPPGVLIVGSQNVLSNISDRIQIRQGYTVDGSINTIDAPVLSSFDWLSKLNGEINMRGGGLTMTGNDGVLQYRYVDSLGAISWRNLLSGLSSVSFNFTTFWNTTESVREVLFVNGESNIKAWNGAITTILSATTNTITKSGTDSWADSGFYTALVGRSVVVNGTTYTYTGGESTTTLTGVTPDPSAEASGSVAHQSVVITANSTMTDIPATFENALIQVLNNQVGVGALNSPAFYLSKVNSYTDYSQSAPRQTGEGGTLILDQNLVAFNVQGNQQSQNFYISTRDIWYTLTFDDFVSATGASGQNLGAVPIKTGQRQGTQSQAFVSNMKNNVITVTNEPTIDMIGVMENYFTQIQTQNISDSIKLDVDTYNFTDGSIAYWRYYILVAVPKEGLVLVYNLSTNSWEAPQTLPVSRFYIVNGELYGHSYNTLESYKLFEGYADRVYSGFTGFPISMIARFSYQNYGNRSAYKSATALYVEGYINSNTTLTANITYELDGCETNREFQLVGSDGQFVCLTSSDSSLGKTSLGKVKLGGSVRASLTGLPPKFRWIPTFSNKDFFEGSISFEVLGVDNRMELIAFGLNSYLSTQEPVQIKQ